MIYREGARHTNGKKQIHPTSERGGGRGLRGTYDLDGVGEHLLDLGVLDEREEKRVQAFGRLGLHNDTPHTRIRQ